MKKSFHSPDYYYGAKQTLKNIIDRVRYDKDIISKNDITLLIWETLSDIESEYLEQQRSVLNSVTVKPKEIK